jgi:hypothetical protein
MSDNQVVLILLAFKVRLTIVDTILDCDQKYTEQGKE